MKKILVAFLLIVCMQFSLSAQESKTYIDSAVPVNPIVMGQGGAFTANASGYNSLFKNPAGFAAGKGDITLLSVNAWMFLDQSMLDFIQDPEGYFESKEEAITTFVEEFDQEDLEAWLAGMTQEELIDLLTDLGLLSGWDQNPDTLEDYLETIDWENTDIAGDFINLVSYIYEDLEGEPLLPSGNIRAGFNAGFGIVKKGLGLGMALDADAAFTGYTLLNTSGAASVTATITAGYALELFDFLKIGADLRPLYKAYVPIDGSQIIDGFETDDIGTALSTGLGYYGWGVGIDVGAIASLGPFNVGISLTDLFGTRMHFDSAEVTAIMESIQGGNGFPEGSEASGDFIVPMDVCLGAGFHPDLGGLSLIIDPQVSVEISDVVNTLASGEELKALDIFKFGAAVRLLRFLDVRAGYNAGYVSGGIGLDLLFLNLNVAGFLKANSEVVGYADYGASAEVAIRF